MVALKLARLWQPRSPAFWLLVVLNVLSTAISYVLRSHDLPLAISLLLGAFAFGNVLLGIRIAVGLMRDGSPGKD